MDKINNQPELLANSDAPWQDQVVDYPDVAAYLDKYPVVPGHMLFVPKDNSMSSLTIAFENAVRYGKARVNSNQWDGFNVGFNYGQAAGQTVEWAHIHLIPRHVGDVEDPVGGVRNTIPGKGNYKKW